MSSDENTKIAGLRAVTAQRISASDPGPEITDDACQLAIESALTIDVGNLDSFTLLCTPNDKRAMTVGFLFSEGVIDEVDDISLLRECEDDDDVMRVKLADPRKGAASEGRNLLIVSSCGMCGSESIEDRVAALPVVGETLKVPVETLWKVQRAMRNRQTLFDHSGGTHAAGIFDKNGEIVAVAEDIGRHNALDKAIGKCLLAKTPPRGLGAALSGRVSLEMVGKCARAGIEVIAAVSATTSLALDAAEHSKITLLAFVRETRATVFTRPARVLE
jgi:FdhD protein